MKKNKLIPLFIIALSLTGCVQTQYHKSITVSKDANGNVIGVVEEESVTQPNQQGWPMKFEYLKGVQP